EPQLVAFGLERLDLGHEVEAHRARERGLDLEPGPAGLLDQVDRVAVRQPGPGARDPLPQPFAEVGGPAQVDEEGVGYAEVTADGTDPGEPGRDAHPMIDIPAKREEPVGHRPLAIT